MVWKPGECGNPNGQPKGAGDVKKLARTFTKNAINALAEIMQDERVSASARVSACEALLNRGWGKPVQPVELGPAGVFDDMSDADLDRFIYEHAERIVPAHDGPTSVN